MCLGGDTHTLPNKDSVTIGRAFFHPHTEIISSEHCPEENIYLSSPEHKRVQSTCTHTFMSPRKTVHRHMGLSVLPISARKPMESLPSHSPREVVGTTSNSAITACVHGSRRPCDCRNDLPRGHGPSGQGAWLRQSVTSVSFWAGGQRRASHVQRQRGKQLCGRGNHKLGGRLCPS